MPIFLEKRRYLAGLVFSSCVATSPRSVTYTRSSIAVWRKAPGMSTVATSRLLVASIKQDIIKTSVDKVKEVDCSFVL